jgi:biopolymer transport protein ExbD
VETSSNKIGKLSGVNADINVTPMADIMLVLLIIFMITTPLLQKGITVNMPKAFNVIEMPEAEKRDALVVGMDRSERTYLGNQAMDAENLQKALAEAREVRQEEKVYFKCDQGVAYDKVVGSLELIRAVGFEHIGLIVDEVK